MFKLIKIANIDMNINDSKLFLENKIICEKIMFLDYKKSY